MKNPPVDNQSRPIRVGDDVYQALVKLPGKTFSDKIRLLVLFYSGRENVQTPKHNPQR